MSQQNPNVPLFCAQEVQDLQSLLLHDLISYITAISTGLDMRPDTWHEVAPLMRQSRDTLLTHMNVMRFMVSASHGASAAGWAYIQKYADAIKVVIQGHVSAIAPWQAGLMMWCIKQLAHKNQARLTMHHDHLDIEGPGFILDQSHVSVLLGHSPSTNPRQVLSRYVFIMATDQGLRMSVESLEAHRWRIHWAPNTLKSHTL